MSRPSATRPGALRNERCFSNSAARTVAIAAIAEALGCPSRRIAGHDELLATLDEVLPTLAAREEPLLLEVAVSA